jgi:PAS domain S-box-containing protein
MNSLISYYKNLVNQTSRTSLDVVDEEFYKHQALTEILRQSEEFFIDLQGFIVSVHLEGVNITGYEEWELIGKSMSVFYSAEDQLVGRPLIDLERAGARGILIVSGIRVKKRNVIFWAKMKLKKQWSDAGIHIGYKMYLQDATHKVVGSHRIQKIKDEYLSLFNNSFIGIFKFSTIDYKLIMINEKAMSIAFPFAEESSQKSFDKIFDSPEDLSNLLKYLSVHKKIEDFEFKLKDSDRWLMISCRQFHRENFVEGILVDITDVRENSQELNRLSYELDQFIYHASHELRSPLSSMLGIVNLIEMDKGEDVIPGHTRILREKINYLDDLLKNIVAIAFNNKSSVVQEPIAWKDFIPSLLKEFEGHSARVDINYSINQTLPFVSDMARLRIILRNLISNVIKYYNPGREKSWAYIEVNVNEKGTYLKIEDNGTGINQDYQKNIFRMFYKANTHSKGHGLGLYIVKIMTEKLRGTIEVTSKVNNGTVFHIYLPCL